MSVKFKLIFDEWHESHCGYGQGDSTGEDYIKDCDCDEELVERHELEQTVEGLAMNNKNKIIIDYILDKLLDKVDEEQCGLEGVIRHLAEDEEAKKSKHYQYYMAWFRSNEKAFEDACEKIQEVQSILSTRD